MGGCATANHFEHRFVDRGQHLREVPRIDRGAVIGCHGFAPTVDRCLHRILVPTARRAGPSEPNMPKKAPLNLGHLGWWWVSHRRRAHSNPTLSPRRVRLDCGSCLPGRAAIGNSFRPRVSRGRYRCAPRLYAGIETWLRTAVSSICLHALEGCLLWMNELPARILGYSADKTIGR
jgi:hypothetical protein